MLQYEVKQKGQPKIFVVEQSINQEKLHFLRGCQLPLNDMTEKIFYYYLVLPPDSVLYTISVCFVPTSHYCHPSLKMGAIWIMLYITVQEHPKCQKKLQHKSMVYQNVKFMFFEPVISQLSAKMLKNPS
jgi:hypothetical protein